MVSGNTKDLTYGIGNNCVLKILRGFVRKEIAEIFGRGEIRAPVHLRKGREQQLIDIFTKHEIGDDDYVYAYWDAHELALLKGVPREDVKQAIMDGRSIALWFSCV